MNELTPVDPNAPKKPAVVKFKIEAIEMVFKSQEAGRPIYEDREFVEIRIPGDMRSVVVEPVNEEHRQRWPEQYMAFKRGLEQPRHGTPLRNWPNSRMTPARIAELAFYNIVTVEELAAVSDGNLPNLGMGGRDLRRDAILFLEVAAKGTAPLERIANRNEELVRENARLELTVDQLRDENARLRDQIKEISRNAGA